MRELVISFDLNGQQYIRRVSAALWGQLFRYLTAQAEGSVEAEAIMSKLFDEHEDLFTWLDQAEIETRK